MKGYGSEDYRLLSLKVYQAKKGDRKAFTFFIADDDPSKLMVADDSRNKFEKPREIELDQAKEIIDGMVLSSNIDPQFLEFIKSQEGAYYEVVGIDTVIVRPEEPEYVSEDWEYREEEGEQWYKAQMWKRTKALMNKIKEKFPSIKIASASERGLILEFSSSPFTIYQYSKAGDRTKLESYDDFLKALVDLSQEIVFVYKSPIGFYVRIIEFVGGASISKRKLKPIISRLENTAYSLSEELSPKGEIVVISISVLSINKSKKSIKNLYNHNFMFSNTIDIKDIQENAKPFSEFLSKYYSTDMVLKIPQKAKPKSQKKQFKNWSVFPVEQDVFKKKVFIVMITRAESKKYPKTINKMGELAKLAKKNKTLKDVNNALIQLVILRPKNQRGHALTQKYEYLDWLLFSLFREGKEFFLSLATHLTVSDDEKTKLSEAVWKQLKKIDKDIP